jgi:hypothetical protein
MKPSVFGSKLSLYQGNPYSAPIMCRYRPSNFVAVVDNSVSQQQMNFLEGYDRLSMYPSISVRRPPGNSYSASLSTIQTRPTPPQSGFEQRLSAISNRIVELDTEAGV